LIWLAPLLAAAQPAEPWCGRSRSPDEELQPCEVRRYDRADILDAAQRPSVRGLGADVIRFSLGPSLGGHGLIVEIVGDGTVGAEVRVFTLWGHPRDSWRVETSRRFALSPGRFRQLAASVDAAITHRVLPPPEREDQQTRIVCMDGPGYLTERVRDGTVSSLTGFCPPNQRDPHPNEVIATLIRNMLCRRHDPAADRAYWGNRRCYAPPVTMRGE
jgi:hypothetical protein